MTETTRKIIQIATAGVENAYTTQCNVFLFALCDDGTAWRSDDMHPGWIAMEPIPQGDVSDAK